MGRRPLIVLGCIVVFYIADVHSEDDVRVTIPGLGQLRGSVNASLWAKRRIYQFQGIPFARPPSGEFRFRPPVPPLPWDGELNATEFKRRCPQALTEEDMIDMKENRNVIDFEDCLYLNVYTTQKPGECSKKFPVMFWIHGGSFRVGSAHGFRPNHLLEQDVVLVTIQYRLGPFGFLSLQDENISGNMGLLDMVMALEWTHDHIAHFCGDEERITIFGQSSGGSAVSLMLASPLTKGRFHRAIIQSGGALCDWTMDHNAADHAKEIAREVKCTGDNQQIYECLKKVSVYDIISAHSTFTENIIAKHHQVNLNGGNHAVVQIAGNQRFLTEDPKTIFSEGRFHKVPTMVGFTKHEGTMILGNIHSAMLSIKNLVVQNIVIPDDAFANGPVTISDVYDFILDRNLTAGSEFVRNGYTEAVIKFSGINDHSGAIADVFNKYYFDRAQVGNFSLMVPGLVDICGILLLKACIFLQAKKLFNRTDTYVYTFNYQGHITKFGYNLGLTYPFPGGVAHSDDLVYLFPDDKGNLSERESAMAKTMVELWSNFAISGKPTPATGVKIWPKMTHPYGPYLRIKAHPEVRDNILDEYNITVTEGLHHYPPPDIDSGSNRSSSTAIMEVLIILMFILVFTVR